MLLLFLSSFNRWETEEQKSYVTCSWWQSGSRVHALNHCARLIDSLSCSLITSLLRCLLYACTYTKELSSLCKQIFMETTFPKQIFKINSGVNCHVILLEKFLRHWNICSVWMRLSKYKLQAVGCKWAKLGLWVWE